MDLHYSPPTGQRYTSQTDRPVLQLHVTAQFYLENKGKYILEARGHANPKDMKKKRETDRDKDREKGPWPLAPGPWPLGSSLICFFSCPWACPM